MIVSSLNEVEAYGRRAARGAGMTWGLAEEAGKAARWLSERKLPGVELLVSLLKANDGRAYETMAPVVSDDVWKSPTGPLCPICTGAALSDRSELLSDGCKICFETVSFPLLLAPFLDNARMADGASCELRWTNVRLCVIENGLALACDGPPAYLSERADEVWLSVSGRANSEPTHQPRSGGVEIQDDIWRELNLLAKRTYVPATEESRARGAGAGRTDND